MRLARRVKIAKAILNKGLESMLKQGKIYAALLAVLLAAGMLGGCGVKAGNGSVPVTSPMAGSAREEVEPVGAPAKEEAEARTESAASPAGEEKAVSSGAEKVSGVESAAEEKEASSSASNGKHLSPLEHYYQGGDFWDGCPERNVQLLTPNEYSRPQIPIDEIHDIVIHFVDEPGSTAMQNRDYFESLKDGSGRSVSSHFVIGLDGEIVQCVPLDEVAYASNNRNHDTISIENCHPDPTGKFTDETYISCVNLTAWLCYAFQITPDHVIRHYDITEKDCPRYFVQHEDAWLVFKEEVAERYYELEKTYGKRRSE